MKGFSSLVVFFALSGLSSFALADYRCEYRNGIIVESRGVCPTGTVTLGRSGSSHRFPSLNAGVSSETAREIGKMSGESIAGLLWGSKKSGPDASVSTVQRKLNVIKEIDRLVESGSISKDMGDNLKAQALR